MKNIHLLPTKNPSKLFIHNAFNDIRFDERNLKHDNNQNIYITNDEEIKVGDWYYLPRTNSVYKCNEDPTELNLERRLGVAKIILTTDKDLIADGVQAIDDEFLQWFVKNPTCEFVEVEDWYNKFLSCCRSKEECYCNKKRIIIPSEPKQEWDYLEGFINQFIGEEAELSNDDWTVSDFLEWLKLNKFKIVKVNN